MNVTDVKGIGKATAEKLSVLGIESAEQLLEFLPSSYIDLQSPRRINEYGDGDFAFVRGRVLGVSSGRGRNARVVVRLSDENVRFEVVFYNQSYYFSVFHENEEYYFLGKCNRADSKIYLVNPIFERSDKIKQFRGVYTVYPTKGLIGQGTFKNIVRSAMSVCQAATLIGDDIRSKFSMLLEAETLCCAHFPENMKEVELAHEAMLTTELVTFMTVYGIYKKGFEPREVHYVQPEKSATAFAAALPYTLTESQVRAVSDIVADLTSDKRMNRIIVGDVGSGKTAVAFCALYMVACSGRQGVMVAPTGILAAQHYNNARAIFDKLGVTTALLTSAISVEDRNDVLRRLKNGDISLLFATHSAFSDSVEFASASLAVIDEQHRFGVAQRSTLEKKGNIDVLMLTATPIPRTLSLIMYDDLNVSELKNRAEGRNVITKIVSQDKTADMWKYVRVEAERGEKTYIICPKIYDVEGVDLFSAEALYKSLVKKELRGLKVSLLHGRMSPAEKDGILSSFGLPPNNPDATNVLVSTTVVEVGIDVRTAKNMIILNADRFGLSALHQLRGRVGRDGRESFCFLQTSNLSERAIKRLGELSLHDNGSELAEIDFELRGGGDIWSLKQSGVSVLSDKYLAKLTPATMRRAKIISEEIYALPNFSKIFAAVGVEKYINLINDITIN